MMSYIVDTVLIVKRQVYEGVEKELPRLTLTRLHQVDLLGRQIL